MGLTRKNVVDARSLIEDSEHWNVGFAYFDGRYCLGGALAKAITDNPRNMYTSEFEPYLKDFIKFAGLTTKNSVDSTVYRFNDNHTHEEVLALLDKVIEGMS